MGRKSTLSLLVICWVGLIGEGWVGCSQSEDQGDLLTFLVIYVFPKALALAVPSCSIYDGARPAGFAASLSNVCLLLGATVNTADLIHSLIDGFRETPWERMALVLTVGIPALALTAVASSEMKKHQVAEPVKDTPNWRPMVWFAYAFALFLHWVVLSN